MADIITYPENGITYDADDASGYLATRRSGVYSADEDFAVTAAGKLSVAVSAGQAWVRPARFKGRSIIMEQPETITLTAADPVRTRIDRIVLRYDAAARKTSLLVLEGIPDSASPAPPEISRTALVYDLSLATITRKAGSSVITAADITDTRIDEAVCGVMRDSVTGIPTAELLKQARARIAELEETASGSAAAADKSATAAAASQSAAAGSASTASTKASAAASSASAAQSAAREATAQATTATRQATAAAGSASAAEESAETAGSSAQNAKASEAAAAKSAAEAKAATGFDPNNYYSKTEADQKFGTPYALPVATTTALGGVKLSEDFATDEDGTLHLAGGNCPFEVGDFIHTTNSVSPAARWGGTWEEIAQDRVLMGASSAHAAGTTVEAGLPNITGTAMHTTSVGLVKFNNAPQTGSFYVGGSCSGVTGSTYTGTSYKLGLDASRSSAVYGRSKTVQPAAYYVHIWHRVA